MSNTATSHEFYRLEELGRMMALEPNSFTGSDFLEWLEGIAGACKYLTNWFDDMGAILRLQNEELGGRFKDFSEVAYELWVFTQYVIPRIKELFTPPSKYPQEPLIVVFNVKGPEIYSVANSHLASACYYASRALQRQVCWFCQPSLEYNYPRYECNYTSATQVVNDITVVFHRMIEAYDQYTSYAVSPKAYYQPDTTNEAITVLKRWDKAIRVFHELGLYSNEDYPVLMGYAHNNRVDLKVGSAMRHLTKIDLTSREVEYWDRDVPIVDAIGCCFEQIGGKLVNYKSYIGRALYTFSLHGEQFVSLILGLATSMDFRLNGLVQIYYNLFKHRIEYLRRVLNERGQLKEEDLAKLVELSRVDHDTALQTMLNQATPKSKPGSASIGPVIYYAIKYNELEVYRGFDNLYALSNAYIEATTKGMTFQLKQCLREDESTGANLWAIEHYADWSAIDKEAKKLIWYKNEILAKFLGKLHWYFLLGINEEYNLTEVD